ncbi:MAG TPA: IPT/TIG domain-containing protein [Mycobacteriales bacterium]|nr:IPT/TIG domain-containing protein [Mycobacteriales bacterium]
MTGLARVSAAPRVPSTATRLGRVAPSVAVSGDVALKPRDPAALTAAATAVSTPSSPAYRHYLPAGKFRSTYGPTATSIAEVEAALRAAHLRIGSVSGNGMLISFSGTAAQAEAAFHGSLATFRLSSGRVGMQMTSAPKLPATIASQVAGVIGLSTLARPVSSIEHWTKQGAGHEIPLDRHPLLTHAPGAPDPCAAAVENANEENGLTYDHLAHAYGLDGLFNAGDLGAGQHIAVYELYPYSASDVSTFDTCYFGTAGAVAMVGRLNSILVDGGAGTGVGAGSDEADLDVEDVSAFAPDADIDVYTGPPTNTGYLDTYNQIVTQDTDQFVTSSYGSEWCEQQTLAYEPGLVDTENQIFEEAALQGQTVLNAAGDSGSDECAPNGSPLPESPYVSAGDPSSQPFVTSVGGTAVIDDSNRPTEQVWNDGNYGGSGGGGTSALWSAPSWQQSAIASIDPSVFAAAYGSGASFGSGEDQPCPQATSTDDTVCRTVPDVTAEADEYTGAPGIYDHEFGGWVDFGGTSSSTPLWAAMLADVQASAGCQSSGPLGFISPKLYAIGANASEAAASFNDVTTGNNDDYAISGGQFFPATTGYDLASGLGSPRLTARSGKPALAAYLCAMGPSTAPAISGLSPTVEPLDPSGTLTISGTNFTGATAVSIGGYQVPTADFTVASDSEIDVTPPPPASSLTGGDPGETGAGPAIVSVTGPGGTSAMAGSASRLEYVDTSASSSVPSVGFISGDIGAQAGGNTVTVYGSGFERSGTSDVEAVTVGGLPASSYTVLSADKMTVTIPAYQSGRTSCAGIDLHPDTELCQTQLVVTGSAGSSSTTPIVPLYEGSTDGSTPCTGCASLPARTEYDYTPAPTVTSLSTTYLSELGFNVVSIYGQGFAYPGYDWTLIGSPTSAASQNYFALSVTPNEIDLLPNGTNNFSVNSLHKSLRVVTAAGTSAPTPVIYAGIPKVTSVSPAAGPAGGGTTITVTGEGLDAVAPSAGGYLEYVDDNIGLPRDQLSGITVASSTSLTATTPQVLAGTDEVTACTVSGCSFLRGNPDSPAAKSTSFVFYLPGNPVVTAVVPHHGPASGANLVEIRGHNLSNPVSVMFGKRAAVVADDEFGPSASANSIEVQPPPGTPKKVVNVVVTTAESEYAPGGAPSAITATTTYRYVVSPPSAPQSMKTKERTDSLVVSWVRPLVNGGAPITGYRIIIRPLNLFSRKQPKPVKFRVGPHVRSDVIHLHPEVYIAEVKALNKHGAGPAAFVLYPKRLNEEL